MPSQHVGEISDNTWTQQGSTIYIKFFTSPVYSTIPDRVIADKVDSLKHLDRLMKVPG